jgi:hypothetical protein
MVEEKKPGQSDDNVEDLLEKSLKLVTAPNDQHHLEEGLPHPLPEIEHDDTPTCSLIQPKPRRKWTRMRATADLEKMNEDVMPPIGGYTHTRVCGSCADETHVENSLHPRGTSGADWEVRDHAVAEGWDVRLLISGHLLYTCSRCRLKAA